MKKLGVYLHSIKYFRHKYKVAVYSNIMLKYLCLHKRFFVGCRFFVTTVRHILSWFVPLTYIREKENFLFGRGNYLKSFRINFNGKFFWGTDCGGVAGWIFFWMFLIIIEKFVSFWWDIFRFLCKEINLIGSFLWKGLCSKTFPWSRRSDAWK